VDDVALFGSLLSIQDVQALYALGTHGVYRTVDQVPDGSTYLRMPGTNMDINRRAIIDLSQSHLNKNLDNIAPGESGRHAVQMFTISNGGSSVWMLLGTWTLSDVGSLTLTYHGGSGFNTNANQQAVTTITVRSGNNTHQTSQV
jgi:hypothetical protein